MNTQGFEEFFSHNSPLNRLLRLAGTSLRNLINPSREIVRSTLFKLSACDPLDLSNKHTASLHSCVWKPAMRRGIKNNLAAAVSKAGHCVSPVEGKSTWSSERRARAIFIYRSRITETRLDPGRNVGQLWHRYVQQGPNLCVTANQPGHYSQLFGQPPHSNDVRASMLVCSFFRFSRNRINRDLFASSLRES